MLRKGYDLLDDLRRAVQVNESLVDSHLEAVPGFGTLTARGLARRDAHHLGRHPYWSLYLQLLVLRTTDQVGAH